MFKLAADYSVLSNEADKLIELLDNINSLQPRYQILVAEILLLRLFDSLVETIRSITIKIMCGALYVDGSQPVLQIQSRSRAIAINNMTNHRRRKPRHLQWSRVKEIKENVKYVIDPNEHFLNVLNVHVLFLEEIRWIRNRIAHNNAATRKNYRQAVLRYYGAYVNSVRPGILLLSPRQRPVLLRQYLMKSQILVETLIKG